MPVLTKGRPQIHNLILFKKLEKEEQTKSKVKRRKDIINIRVEIKLNREKSIKTKREFF